MMWRQCAVLMLGLALAAGSRAAPFVKVVDVFYPGLLPEEQAADMEGCYAIPSLLFVPRPVPTLLAVAEAKHGRVCGDVVNSTLLMRRSVDFGATWSAPYFPYRPWAPLRKWGQPQMVFDNDTSTAMLLFSNETLSGSPGSVQVSACHGPLFQPSRESIGRRCTVSLDWFLACTGQPTPSPCLPELMASSLGGLIGLATCCCPTLTSDHISHESRDAFMSTIFARAIDPQHCGEDCVH